MTCKSNSAHRETLMDLYNKMIEQQDYVYNKQKGGKLINSFNDVDVDTLEKIFDTCGKPYFFSNELKNFFSTEDKKWRCQHSFSTYILGIILYNKISALRDSFKDVFSESFYQISGEMMPLVTDEKRDNSFLYSWYPTALYHDIGYYYEEKDIIDCNEEQHNSHSLKSNESETSDDRQNDFLDIIREEKMMNDCYFGILDSSLRKPKALWNTAAKYLKIRLETTRLSHRNRKCLDHGIAGGLSLYEHMKKIQKEHDPNGDSMPAPNGLIYSQKFLKTYNTMSAWAIACHNIQVAMEKTKKGSKYNELELKDLIIPKGQSFINIEDTPLLFLLDFVDTFDPVKRFGFESLDCFEILDFQNNILKLRVAGCKEGYCLGVYNILKEISSDLDFLKSDTFKVDIDKGGNSITFTFGKESLQESESDSIPPGNW